MYHGHPFKNGRSLRVWLEVLPRVGWTVATGGIGIALALLTTVATMWSARSHWIGSKCMPTARLLRRS